MKKELKFREIIKHIVDEINDAKKKANSIHSAGNIKSSGDEVVKTVGSFLVVELMRHGKSPQEACEEAISRIVTKPNSDYKNFQVGYIAVNKQGETASYSIHQYFSMTRFQDGNNKNIQSDFFIKP